MTTALLALLVLLQADPAPQGEAARLFALGQQLYAEGDADGAVAAFEGARATGWTDPALAYNLGTACLATDDLGCAVLHLERAHRLRPADATIQHNLRIAYERADLDATAFAPPNPVVRLLGLNGLFGLTGVVYLALLGLLGLWLRQRRPVLRRALVVLAPITAGLLILSGLAWQQSRTPAAVVMASETTLHAAPTSDATARMTLRAGTRVRLLDRTDDWAEVRLPDGTDGWLPARAVEAI